MIEALKQKLPSDFCLLCGGAPDIIGVFVPDTPATWGALKGKSRHFRYCLCNSCYAKPETPERAEKIIRCELQARSTAHEQ